MSTSTAYARAREQHDLSLEEASSLLGISVESLVAYECGEEQPDAVTVRHMALLYGQSADMLIGIDWDE